MKQLTYNEALYRLAAYCSHAERCVSDIRKKMDTWAIDKEDQKKILNHLRKEKFLDEERYCRAFVRDKTRFGKWGIYKIRFELKKKQISDELIDEALKEIDSDENRDMLIQLLNQKKKSIKGKNDFEITQKLMRFAAGRGFSQEEILQALKATEF